MKIAILLGRRSAPTCGVADHSVHLVEALSQRNDVILMDVHWSERGWPRAMVALHREYRSNPREWVVLQFTPLAWSERGFPVGALLVAIMTRLSGAKLAIIIHDPIAFTGSRIRDQLRRKSQHAVMRGLVCCAQISFVTLDPRILAWARGRMRSHLKQLPIGSNFVSPTTQAPKVKQSSFSVLVFGVTKGQEKKESEDIAKVMKAVSGEVAALRVVVMGNGSETVEHALKRLLAGASVGVTTTGVIFPDRVEYWLSNSDALLFVRGEVSARRGTAVAAISHSLPIVGYEGPETGWPVTEAGVVLVPRGRWMELAAALIRLAKDPTSRESLQALSRNAFEKYFDWDGIAHRMEQELRRAL